MSCICLHEFLLWKAVQWSGWSSAGIKLFSPVLHHTIHTCLNHFPGNCGKKRPLRGRDYVMFLARQLLAILFPGRNQIKNVVNLEFQYYIIYKLHTHLVSLPYRGSGLMSCQWEHNKLKKNINKHCSSSPSLLSPPSFISIRLKAVCLSLPRLFSSLSGSHWTPGTLLLSSDRSWIWMDVPSGPHYGSWSPCNMFYNMLWVVSSRWNWRSEDRGPLRALCFETWQAGITDSNTLLSSGTHPNQTKGNTFMKHFPVPGRDLAHLTAEMTCCPPSLLRVVMSREEVSGRVLS